MMRACEREVQDAVFEAIKGWLPERIDTHPLGCHRRRIPDEVCFRGILIRLVTGAAWTTIEMMMTNQIGDLLGDIGRHYGIAFGIVDDHGQAMGGAGSQGTFDWGGYFNTQYFADPNEEVIGILMKQTRDIESDYTGWKFRQLVFQTIDD